MLSTACRKYSILGFDVFKGSNQDMIYSTTSHPLHVGNFSQKQSTWIKGTLEPNRVSLSCRSKSKVYRVNINQCLFHAPNCFIFFFKCVFFGLPKKNYSNWSRGRRKFYAKVVWALFGNLVCPTTPNQTRPHHTTPNHTKPNQTTPNHTQPHPTTPNHTKPHPTKPHQTTPKPHHAQPNQTTPHHITPYQTKPNHTQPNYIFAMKYLKKTTQQS